MGPHSVCSSIWKNPRCASWGSVHSSDWLCTTPAGAPAACSMAIRSWDSCPDVHAEIISSSSSEFSSRFSIDWNRGSVLSAGIPIVSHNEAHSSSDVTAIAHQCPPLRIGLAGSFSGAAQGYIP